MNTAINSTCFTTRLERDLGLATDMGLATDIATNIGEKMGTGTTRHEPDEHDNSQAANIAINIGEKATTGTSRLERDKDDNNDNKTDLIDIL